MKQLLKIFFLISAINVYGQSNESFFKYNFGILWTKTDNSLVYGFIGENYQRMRIKIISVTKDTLHNDTYLVNGKTMVKNNTCNFNGLIKIKNVTPNKEMHLGVDDEYKDKGIKKEGALTAEYHFYEDSAQLHAGIFNGMVTSYWYIDKNNKLKYDDIESFSDDYRNNQFVGTWTSYKSHEIKVCNWGDYRLPGVPNDFDCGAGEFSPCEKYLKYGWQNLRDAYLSVPPDSSALREEERHWWKK